MSREKILIRTSWISTLGNSALSASKIVIGLLTGSLAVLGDGIDSATDVIISVAMIFTARIVSKPPTRKFVFGYEKAESITAKILSLVIFYAGMQMLIFSIQRIFSGEERELPGTIAIYVTILSVIGKLILASYQQKQGKKIESSLLIANAINMRNDVLTSVGVLTGLIFTIYLKLPVIDSITGLLVSFFIIKSAISIFMDSSIELMDGVKDETIYKKIFEAIDTVPEASNPHRVRSRQIGNMNMISLDIEVEGNLTLNEAHEIAEKVENRIKQSVRNVYDIVVHVEPRGKQHSKEKFGIDKEMI